MRRRTEGGGDSHGNGLTRRLGGGGGMVSGTFPGRVSLWTAVRILHDALLQE